MEFILQMQAKLEANQVRHDENLARHEENFARYEARMAKAEARMTKAEARMDAMDQRFDRRMNAIGKLIQQGMKTIAALDKRMDQLATAQKENGSRGARFGRLPKSYRQEIPSFSRQLRQGRQRSQRPLGITDESTASAKAGTVIKS